MMCCPGTCQGAIIAMMWPMPDTRLGVCLCQEAAHVLVQSYAEGQILDRHSKQNACMNFVRYKTAHRAQH